VHHPKLFSTLNATQAAEIAYIIIYIGELETGRIKNQIGT
jgi:hypothetical protein